MAPQLQFGMDLKRSWQPFEDLQWKDAPSIEFSEDNKDLRPRAASRSVF